MAYVLPADFREGTKKDYCFGLELSPSDAPDAELTTAITRLSERIDQVTNDHFEAENAATFELDGHGETRLYLPRCVRTVTTVKTRDSDGVLTTELAASYRMHSSLNAAGTEAEGDFDWIGVIPGQVLVNGGKVWPDGVQTVQVVGNFSWAATPTDIKRCVALLVWEHFTSKAKDLRWVKAWSTNDARFERADSEPFGIPEADELVARYRRPELIVV